MDWRSNDKEYNEYNENDKNNDNDDIQLHYITWVR